MQAVHTIISGAASANVIFIGGFGLNLLKSVIVRSGGGVCYGIISGYSVNLTSVGVVGFATTNAVAIYLNGCNCNASNVMLWGNYYAFVITGCNLTAVNCASSYNSRYGFEALGSSSLTIKSPCWAYLNDVGMFVGGGAQVTADGFTSQNNSNGIYAFSGGTFQVTLNGADTITLNTTDLVVAPFGQILKAAGTSLFYTTTSQTINTVTASGVIAP